MVGATAEEGLGVEELVVPLAWYPAEHVGAGLGGAGLKPRVDGQDIALLGGEKVGGRSEKKKNQKVFGKNGGRLVLKDSSSVGS